MIFNHIFAIDLVEHMGKLERNIKISW